MSRKPPYSWVENRALLTIRKRVPRTKQAGARNAVLALAEACSLARDGDHAGEYTIAELSALAGVSEKRLRSHFAELVRLGEVETEPRFDEHGRDLPKVYRFAGADESSHQADESSGRLDGTADKTSHPTRATDRGPQEEEVTPLSLNGNSARRASEREREQVEFDPRQLVTLRRIP